MGIGVKFLHIERKITSLVHSHPPSHYVCKHVFLPTTWILMMFVHYPPFPHIFCWKLTFFGAWGSFAQVLAAASLFFLSTHTWENSLVNISLSSSEETSWSFLRSAFSPDLWTQDALYLRKHNESEPEECRRIPATRVFFEKNKECGSGRPRVI